MEKMKNANHGRINKHVNFDPTRKKGKDEKARGDTNKCCTLKQIDTHMDSLLLLFKVYLNVGFCCFVCVFSVLCL